MQATNNPDEQITVWNTNLRFRLQGKFDGWFYYTDVYKKHILFFGNDYIAVNEKNKKDIPKGYKLVQKESDELYIKLCSEINEQMKKAYKWWNKHQQP